MDEWKPGDKAIIVGLEPDMIGYAYNGDETTVHTCPFPKDGHMVVRVDPVEFHGHSMSLIEPKYLQKPYDGYEVTSWDDCLYFTPRALVRVES